jgi:hypothetical protein
MCHQPITPENPHGMAYFIVNGQNDRSLPSFVLFPAGEDPCPKVIVSQERPIVCHGCIRGTRWAASGEQPPDAVGVYAAEQAHPVHLRGAVGPGVEPEPPGVARGRRHAPTRLRPRFPVVFAIKVTVPAVPHLLPHEPILSDPIIVSLTYFRRRGGCSGSLVGVGQPPPGTRYPCCSSSTRSGWWTTIASTR